MINFYEILDEVESGQAENPYAAKDSEENWIPGWISIDFLNENFGQYSTAQEMIDATESEGLKLYFAWLRDQGILT